MPKGIYQIPYPDNEPINSYEPGSPELKSLLAKYDEMYNQSPIDVPMYIGGKEVRTNNKMPMSPPHDHARCWVISTMEMHHTCKMLLTLPSKQRKIGLTCLGNTALAFSLKLLAY